ncbi:MAG: Re/Si-specific NAD(P)(+) transhydrogenase subunit alpha [Pyrinomonadaceae bacterium]
MRIAILREAQTGEARVALMPESVRKLVALKAEVVVESNAGSEAGASDADYENAGAHVTENRAAILESTNILVCVNCPATEDLLRLPKGAAIVGFLKPLDEPLSFETAITQSLSMFALELIPRTTRAQAMDALSSMATVVGYKAVLIAAAQVPRMFPMLMTAAGTITPARVLVLGAGVAGLQAIATARRLGAVVEAYDIRAAAGEQVHSLGATFLEVDLGGIETEDAGGYAREVSEEALQRGRTLIAEHARTSDVVITTAQVPGRPAPLLLTEDAVDGMKSGAVVVDLAGASGGNCAVSKPDEVIKRNGVVVMSPLNLAATVPFHASQLYSRNLTAFLNLLIKDGELNIDLSDTIVGGSCVTHRGEIINGRVAEAMKNSQ